MVEHDGEEEDGSITPETLNEVRDTLEHMFKDHMMSFIHTPDVLSELQEDDSRIETLKERYPRAFEDENGIELNDLVHNMEFKPGAVLRGLGGPGDGLLSTQYNSERFIGNVLKAQSIQGQTVIPTGKDTTLAAFLKGHGSAISMRGRAALGRAPGFSRTIVPDWVYNEIRDLDLKLGIDLIDAEFTFGAALKDDDGIPMEFKLFNDVDVVPNESNIWFPDMYRDGKTPSGLPKEISDRLKKIRDDPMFAPLKKRNEREETKARAPIGKKEGISPITAYYIMRYLSPWLIKSGMVEQALPKNGKVERIEVLRNEMDDSTLETSLNELLEGTSIKDGKNIDEMFPFEPIRTRYQYPADYPMSHLFSIPKAAQALLFPGEDSELGFIKCPEPTDKDVEKTIQYGLLQKIHAVMSPSRRSGMIQDIFSVFIDGSQHRMIPILRGLSVSKVARNPSSLYIPVAKNGDASLGYTEALIALIEADMKGLAQEDTLKLITDTSKGTREHVSEGAVVIVPGLLILFAEQSNNHSFFDIVYGYSTKGVITQDGTKRLNRTKGFEYLESLIEFCQIGNTEEQINEKKASLGEIIGTNFDETYQCIIQPARDNTKLILVGDNEIQFTLTVDTKLFQKGIRELEVESELQKNGRLNFREFFVSLETDENDELTKDGDGNYIIIENRMPYNSEYELEEGGSAESLEAFAETTGEIMRRASPYGARAFNALGYIVEEGMINSALSAVDTVQGFSATSDFDKLVIGLIGTNQYPGLASVHAAYHYQFLFQQMISPIKNWNVIDKDLFTQGTFLALESFFDKPAMKALYYMLNKKGYISIGGGVGESFSFFETPRQKEFNLASFTGLQNGFAQMVIGYYRLLFAQIRNRLVIARDTKESRKLDETTADIKTLWKNLIVDSIENTPDPKMFALVLRFLAEESVSGVIKIPTWMPVLPEDMLEAKARDSNENEPSQYLKWAYGSNSADLEFFAEVAAAYHASKALSYFENYPKMVKRFVEAVDEDSGHAFLFAILLSPEQPNLSPSPVTGMPVTLTNENLNIMDGIPQPEPNQKAFIEDEDEGGALPGGGGPPPGTSPETQEPPLNQEFFGSPEERMRVNPLLKQIKNESIRYIDGELDDDQYQQNIGQQFSELLALNIDGDYEVQAGILGTIKPIIIFYDDYDSGMVELDEGEIEPDAELLKIIATRLSMMEVEG